MNISPSPPSSISSSSSSRLSFLSATSSHSTFSDYSVASLSSIPSPPQTASKTHAFFASPFPTRPPSPTPSTPPPLQSKTNSFFNSNPQPAIDVSTPTVTHDINIHVIDTSNEPTPRPNHLEPPLSQFWPRAQIQLQPPPPGRNPTPIREPDPTDPDPDEPHAGYLISSPSLSGLATTSPSHSGSPSTPTPSSPPHHQSQNTTTALRLLRPLGHGAFSSVWLADDLSPVPLTLRSRRSLRDLRRQASVTSGGVKPKPRVPSLSLSLSRAGSLRTLRRRVPGTRPISGVRERAGVYLDERHGQMGTGTSDDRDQGVVSAHREIDLPSNLSRSSSASSTSSSFSRNRNVSLSISIKDPQSPQLDGLHRSVSMSSQGSRGGRGRSAKVRLVAVKMTLRGGASVGFVWNESEREEREKEKERTRVAFVREVEVLRHISHPNITPLLTHLSTPTHHVLVLPYLPGGDLLALVNSDAAWSQLRESVLRRIWCEICKAVGWMHGVGLVHRDIKLENILLTTPIFAALAQTPKSDTNMNPGAISLPTLDDLPQSPAPLIKLTDFGLSRFVDIRTEEEKARDREARRRTRMRRSKARQGVSMSDGDSSADEDKHNDYGRQPGEEEEEEEEEYEGPLLSTRCGSEAYAAPELVMGGGRAAGKGVYDARETDAWACGVVLYALLGRRLPFGEGVDVDAGVGQGIKGEDAGRGGGGLGVARRQWLMRIARGEYEWPCFDDDGEGERGEGELIGKRLVNSEGAKRVVEMLLVRNPKKRVRVGDLWEDEWMGGGVTAAGGNEVKDDMGVDARGEYDFCDGSLGEGGSVCGDGEEEEEEEMETEMEMEMEELEKEEEEEEGWIVDQDGIDSIARREVV